MLELACRHPLSSHSDDEIVDEGKDEVECDLLETEAEQYEVSESQEERSYQRVRRN